MTKLINIKNNKTWNEFIISSNFEFYSFLQSWEWWEVQKLSWKKVFRKAIINSKNEIIWVLQILLVNAKRWSYLFVPHWPLIIWDYFKVLNDIILDLKKLAKKHKCSFVRFNSTLKNNKINKHNFKKLGFKNAPMHEHAEDTHLLELGESNENIFNNIKKKDRYYINRAVKEWVEIKINNKQPQIDSLIEMHTNHAHRTNWKNNYSAFSKKFINNLYKIFGKNISTISASYNWKIESILMTIQFGKTCVYYIAASDIVSSKFSPNYLCQWEAIKNAKASGALIYNFWWVSPDSNPKHPIAWVTKFKRKFNWYDYSLLHAQDLIISPKYYINWVIETTRRLKRGYYYKKPE